MQKSENFSLDQKENFSEISGFPLRLLGTPALHPVCSPRIRPPPGDWEITHSSLTGGIKLGTIQYFTTEYKLHLSKAFHAQHLKALYDLFFFFLMGVGRKKKEFKRENLLKSQTPTELNEPLRVNRT